MNNKKKQQQTTKKKQVTIIKTCSECNKTFENQKDLDAHIKKSHNQQTSSSSSSSSSLLLKQQITTKNNNGIINYFCKVCGKIFSSEYSFIQHKKDFHSKKLECTSCNKNFPSERYLKIHTTKSHPLKYPCKQCNERFVSKEARESHVEITHKLKSSTITTIPISEIIALEENLSDDNNNNNNSVQEKEEKKDRVITPKDYVYVRNNTSRTSAVQASLRMKESFDTRRPYHRKTNNNKSNEEEEEVEEERVINNEKQDVLIKKNNTMKRKQEEDNSLNVSKQSRLDTPQDVDPNIKDVPSSYVSIPPKKVHTSSSSLKVVSSPSPPPPPPTITTSLFNFPTITTTQLNNTNQKQDVITNNILPSLSFNSTSSSSSSSSQQLPASQFLPTFFSTHLPSSSSLNTSSFTTTPNLNGFPSATQQLPSSGMYANSIQSLVEQMGNNEMIDVSRSRGFLSSSSSGNHSMLDTLNLNNNNYNGSFHSRQQQQQQIFLPRNKKELEEWLNKNKLTSLISILSSEGFETGEDLITLSKLNVVELKVLLKIDKAVLVTRLKQALDQIAG